jgi:hypothetical protein
MTPTMRPYIPMTPAMTMGMTFFMTLPGCRIPVCTILIPDFQVPIYKRERKKEPMSEPRRSNMRGIYHTTTYRGSPIG